MITLKIKNLLLYFAIFFVGIFSIFMKIHLLDYAKFRNHNMFGLAHFELAGDLLCGYISEDENENNAYRRFVEKREITKYPLLLSRLYLWGGYLFKNKYHFDAKEMQEPDYVRTQSRSSFQKICIMVHILLFSLTAFACLLLPVPFGLKSVTFFLFTLSYTAHQMTWLTTLHLVVGYFILLSFLVSAYLYKSDSTMKLSILGGLISGCALATFFPGVVAIFPLFFALILKYKEKRCSLFRFAGSFLVILFINFLLLDQNYLPLRSFILGEGPFFYESYFIYLPNPDPSLFDERFSHEFSGYSLIGFKAYLIELLGKEPIIWFFFILSVFFLFKTKKYKESYWLIALITTFLFSIALGFLVTNSTRKIALIFPMVILIASYGFYHLWISKKHIYKWVLVIFLVFMAATLVKYNYLSYKDTRYAAFNYIHKKFKGEKLILVDHKFPYLVSSLDEPEIGKFRMIWPDALIAIFHNLYKKDPLFKSQVDSWFSGNDYFNKPEALHGMAKTMGVDYYISNSFWRDDSYLRSKIDVRKDTSDLIEKSKLIKTFEPIKGEDFPDLEMAEWPNIYDNSLWSLWRLNTVGPTLKIYELGEVDLGE